MLAVMALLAAVAPPPAVGGDRTAALIDAHVGHALRSAGVAPAEDCTDGEFLRRVTLDLIGRVPTVAEARAFLADNRNNKRTIAVDKLLASPAFAAHVGRVVRAAWVPQATSNLQTQHLGLSVEAWVAARLRASPRYDRLVRDLLTAPLDYLDHTADGPSSDRGGLSPVGFYQGGDLKPETVAGNLGRLFLGTRLECAQCHDHPFDKWTRTQFWQTAAFFASVSPPDPFAKTTPARGELAKRSRAADPLTKKEYAATFLDGGGFSNDRDPRAAFADWLVSPKNSTFARVAVNRVWAQLMGVGLVDPVDDFGPHNEPTHPELLDDLAAEFAKTFDLRRLFRGVVLSRTYQRSSKLTNPAQADPRLYARTTPKGLSAEQLFDAVATATGYREEVPASARRLFGYEPGSPRGTIMGTFGGGAARSDSQTGILQALALMNGEWVARQTDPDRGETLRAVLGAPLGSDDARLDVLYLAALTRTPTDAERTRFRELLERDAGPKRRKQVFADVFWALLNSNEFLLNR